MINHQSKTILVRRSLFCAATSGKKGSGKKGSTPPPPTACRHSFSGGTGYGGQRLAPFFWT